METEIWKNVVGHEGLYEVSNLGRIKSLPRMVYNGHGYYTTKERILKSPPNGQGYPSVVLCDGVTEKSRKVHVLVSAAFLENIPYRSALVIDHINGVKTDPRAKNLRIVTQRFNSSLGYRKNQDRLSSQYVGVCWNKNAKKWYSQINIGGIVRYLGIFSNEIDAADAYQKELSKIQLQGKSRTGLPPDNWRCCILSVLDKS